VGWKAPKEGKKTPSQKQDRAYVPKSFIGLPYKKFIGLKKLSGLIGEGVLPATEIVLLLP